MPGRNPSLRPRRSPSAPRYPGQCSVAEGPWPHPLAERRSAKDGGWESTEHLIPHRAQIASPSEPPAFTDKIRAIPAPATPGITLSNQRNPSQSPPQAGLLVPSNHGCTLAIPKNLPVAPHAPHLGAGYFKGVPLKPLLQTDSPPSLAATPAARNSAPRTVSPFRRHRH